MEDATSSREPVDGQIVFPGTTNQGFNNKAKLAMRKSYGFRTANGIETALYHQLSALLETNFTREFC